IGACGDNEVEGSGRMLDEEGQTRIVCGCCRAVVVVQHELDGHPCGCQLIDEHSQHTLDGHRTRRFEQMPRNRADTWVGAVEGGQRIYPESHQVALRLLEGDAGDLPAALSELRASHEQ